MSGSDAACGEMTGVEAQCDLWESDSNPHTTEYLYDAPVGFENEIGMARAFLDGFTAQDSVSDWRFA